MINAKGHANMEEKKTLKHLDDFALKMSSTKIGLTDYDKDKTYNSEEKPFGLKELGLMLAVMAGIIAIATVVMLIVL